MRAVRILTVMAAALSLGSCEVFQFLFGSVFPGTIALAKAQADLSGKISANDGTAFRLRVVQSGGKGFVILIGNLPSGITAFVYDQDLGLKGTFNGLTADGVMVDADGAIILGSLSLVPATLSTSAAIVSISTYGNTGGADGFFDGASLQPSANFSIAAGSSLLGYATYAHPWAAGGTPGSVQLSAATSDLRIEAILDDGNPSGNVTMAISQNGSGNNNDSSATCWFVTTAKANYTAGGSGLTNALDISPHLDNIDTGSIGFAQGSIMVYDSSAGRFLRVDPATGSTQSSFYSGSDVSSTRIGYLASGGFFYGFDTKTRVLTKYAQWW